jgi:CHRD domain
VKPRRLFAALVLAVLGALLVTGPVAAADPVEHLDATLTGEQEVPGPGDPNGSGDAHVTVYSAKVCYTLRAEDIGRPIAAHIHEGRRGVAGDIVVELNTPEKVADAVFFSSGCERISRALASDLKMHPAHYYVNVHNNRFPGGAIRGQLHD